MSGEWRTRRGRHCAAVVALTVAAGLLAGCGGDSDNVTAVPDEPTSSATSGSASPSVSESPAESPAPTEESSAPVPAECTVPTSDVTYGAGRATLVVDNGPNAGTYELTTEPAKTDESVFQTSLGGQLIGNWRGDQEEELPALEVRFLNDGSICDGPPIVRIYFFGLAYEDNDSTTCDATLDTLTSTDVVGSVTCSGIQRTFGSREPAALDVSATFSLGQGGS